MTSNPNLISLSLPCEWTTFNVPASDLTDLMSLKVGFMDKPQYMNPKWDPPKVKNYGWQFWKTIASALAYVGYCICYAVLVVVAGLWFFAQMVDWFFSTIGWVFYAIGCMFAYAPHVGDIFKLFGFGFDLTHHKTDYMSYRNVSFLNSSNSTNITIKPNLVKYDDTNGSISSENINTTIEEINVSR